LAKPLAPAVFNAVVVIPPIENPFETTGFDTYDEPPPPDEPTLSVPLPEPPP
jgi:hypothetical protein